ncbi:NACHT domain-containing protein [Acinetobacter radioresistens]|uniref:NACHT domain-containing protein n=1 Tax=Acinetobacter radioresistens TaxID=40216 RepID=UPI002245BEDC|nr:NACHT domain-containing protein [Acinetobacter radioresistens]MCX0333317.1 NACHT domain-containing protein [Acinetobacter radioresistens]
MEEIIIQEAVKEVIKQFTMPIYKSLKKFTINANDKLQVTFEFCFSEYLIRNYEKFSKTKTLLYREKPVSLKDFYVRTDLMINSERIDEKIFIEEVENNKRIIILGSAGCGKSTFCKSIFVDLINKPRGLLPVFIELRHLNSLPNKGLYDFILQSLININPSFNKSQLDYALKLGKVLIILDGFDEINREDRDKIEREILNLSSNYHGIRILISSRFDSRFDSWDEFYIYRVQLLDKNKALTLINKLDYDRQVKQSFLNELDTNLYDSHKSFASNPLLLTMMLLTYEQIAEIPNKMHLFYEQAFLTLFNKHDSLKSIYKRKSASQLPLDEFKRCLEAFCLLSYTNRLYYFKENKIDHYINHAIKISGVNCTSEDFLNDLLDSVCILQRDGLGFTFTHRSFQEYFSAQFLANRTLNKKFDLFEKIFSISFQDSVIPMLIDINLKLLEKEWIIPKIEKILSSISLNENINNYEIILLNKFFSSITLLHGEDNGIGYSLGSSSQYFSYFCHFLEELYKEDYEKYLEDIAWKPIKNDFKESLIEVMRESGDIDLSDTSRIDPYVKELIVKAGLIKIALCRIGFLKLKVEDLKRLHTQQDIDVFSLILV